MSIFLTMQQHLIPMENWRENLSPQTIPVLFLRMCNLQLHFQHNIFSKEEKNNFFKGNPFHNTHKTHSVQKHTQDLPTLANAISVSIMCSSTHWISFGYDQASVQFCEQSFWQAAKIEIPIAFRRVNNIIIIIITVTKISQALFVEPGKKTKAHMEFFLLHSRP